MTKSERTRCVHLDKSLRLGLGLREAVSNERAEHVRSDFLRGAKALGDDLLGGAHDLSEADRVPLRRQETAQEGRAQHIHKPWQHSEGDDGGQVLLGRLDVLVHVRVGGEEAKRLTKGNVRNDIEREILRLAAKVERAERMVRRQVFPADEVDKGSDIGVNALLQTLDFFARVLEWVNRPLATNDQSKR